MSPPCFGKGSPTSRSCELFGRRVPRSLLARCPHRVYTVSESCSPRSETDDDVDNRGRGPGADGRPGHARSGRGRGGGIGAGSHPDRGPGRGDVGKRSDVLVQSGRGGRGGAVLRRDDRDLDRDGLAGRLVRLDRDREPAVVVRRGVLPARRGLRRGVHRQRQPRHDGRPVLPQRTGCGRRWRLPRERIVEFRLGDRPRRVCLRRFLPDGRRSAGDGPRRSARDARGRDPARRDHLQGRLACAGPQGNRLLRLRRGGRVRAG